MQIECDRCGTSFDTERDGEIPSQDTTRCPSCGKSYEGGDGDTAAVTVGTNGDEVHIHVHVHRE